MWVSATLLLLLLLLSVARGVSATPIANVILYAGSAFVQGDFGNRATTNNICRLDGLYTHFGCTSGFSLLGYGADGVSNYTQPRNPTNGVFFSGSAPVISGYTQAVIASNWSQLWNTNVYPLRLTISQAMPNVEFYRNTYWSGILGNGALGPTCLDWTDKSNSHLGELGDIIWTNSKWIALTDNVCADQNLFLCVCLSPTSHSPSRAPSRAPSRTPTRIPTTGSPSRSPSRAPTGSPTVVNPVATQTVGAVAFGAGVLVVLIILVA